MKIIHTHCFNAPELLKAFKSLSQPLLAVTLLATLGMATVHANTLQHKTQQDVLQYLDQQQPNMAVVSGERKLPFRELMNQLQDQRVVLVGEQHDRYDHHLNQLAILRAMHQQHPELAIGVEWFQQSFQTVVDDYLAGEITEDELLRQTEYYQRWGYDYRMLRPIMQFAKAHQLPVIALNAPKEITAKAAKSGLTGLSKPERQQIPATIHPAPKQYRDYLEAVFKKHMGGQGDLDNFMLVQRIWDETMAMNVVKHLNAHPKQRMIVFAGAGHLKRGAIPGDVARRIPANKISTLHSVAGTDAATEAESAADGFDYYLLSEPRNLPPTGKLGVWLDEQDGGLKILKLSADGAAADAGLQKRDQILQVNKQIITSMADLLMKLAQQQPGDEVTVLIKRDNQQLNYVFPLK